MADIQTCESHQSAMWLLFKAQFLELLERHRWHLQIEFKRKPLNGNSNGPLQSTLRLRADVQPFGEHEVLFRHPCWHKRLNSTASCAPATSKSDEKPLPPMPAARDNCTRHPPLPSSGSLFLTCARINCADLRFRAPMRQHYWDRVTSNQNKRYCANTSAILILLQRPLNAKIANVPVYG